MDVLVLGSGAREHALAWRLRRDESVSRVVIAPGNGGTDGVAEPLRGLDITDPLAVARHAAHERYGLVVIGPEGPLAAGVADELASTRIPTFGPSRAAARLESSKAFAKEQMRRSGVPTPDAQSFTDPSAALEFIRNAGEPPVVKADWLAFGKGVVVPGTREEAAAAVRDLFASVAAGARIVLETRVDGPEVSAFALVSGEAVVPIGAACDYKRLRDGDDGPNTGGMGAYAPVPWFGPAALEATAAEVFEPIAWRMARDGHPYVGVLYAGLIITADGPMVLEFNARFGDPEAQVLLPLLDGDLATALLGCATGDRGLMETAVAMRSDAAVGVVVASLGYPDAPQAGREIAGVEPSEASDDGSLLCFHAATRAIGDDRYETTGGRVVTMVGRGDSLEAARDTAYVGVGRVTLEGGTYRTDIGAREVPALLEPAVAGRDLQLGDRAHLGDQAG